MIEKVLTFLIGKMVLEDSLEIAKFIKFRAAVQKSTSFLSHMKAKIHVCSVSVIVQTIYLHLETEIIVKVMDGFS